MKKAVIIVGLIISVVFGQAQTFNEWFRQKETQIKYLIEQIIALKGYGEVTGKGYEITHDGLTIIFGSEGRDYKQHYNYFLSLWKVKLNIKDLSKILSVYKMKTDIERQYQLVRSSATEFLIDKERSCINSVYSNLLSKINDLGNEMEMVTNDDQFQLKDDERIQRIDKIYIAVQKHYEFSISFVNQIKLLIANRLKETNEIGKLSSVYGIK